MSGGGDARLVAEAVDSGGESLTCRMAESGNIASVLWRRLDAPGADAARLVRTAEEWVVAGTAVFLQDGEIAHLAYEVRCDARWHTKRGWVFGYIGRRRIEMEVMAHPGPEWTVNGEAVPEVRGCIDLDLNFTPATNLIQFRRLALATGAQVEAPAAWIKVPEFELRKLPQTLSRTSEGSYDYAAPTERYAGVLTVHPSGFVLHYPELWVADRVEVFEA